MVAEVSQYSCHVVCKLRRFQYGRTRYLEPRFLIVVYDSGKTLRRSNQSTRRQRMTF